MVRQITSLLVLLACTPLAVSQGGPPIGPPGSGGSTGNNWKITYSYSGTNTPVQLGGSPTWLNPPDSPNTMAKGIFNSGVPETFHARTEGDITVKVEWDGRDGFGNLLPAPDLVSVIIDASALMTGSGDINGTPVTPTYSLNNGFGDPTTESEGRTMSAHCTGRHIKTFKYSGPIVITKRLSAQAWINAKNAGLTVSVDMVVTVSTRRAYMLPKDVNVTWRADGDLEADTIFELFPKGSPLIFNAIHNVQHFEFALEGPWSQASMWDPGTGQMWSGPNVSVDWNGLDCSYHYTPPLHYNYSFHGCFLRRDMEDLIEEGSAPYQGTPAPKELNLKITDLGDGISAEQKLYLRVHCPIDEWVQDSTQTYVGSKLYKVEIQLSGGKLTQSFSLSEQRSLTANVEVSTEFPIKTPFVDVPIGVKIGHQFSKTVTAQYEANQEITAPGNAVSVVFYIQDKIDKRKGRVSSWNKAGLIGVRQQTPCEWFDPDTFRPYLGFFFKDANGGEIVVEP